MSSKTKIKLSNLDHAILRGALAEVVEDLPRSLAHGCIRESVLEVVMKMEKQAVEVRPHYNVGLSGAQVFALEYMCESQLLHYSSYMRILSGQLQMHLHPLTLKK